MKRSWPCLNNRDSCGGKPDQCEGSSLTTNHRLGLGAKFLAHNKALQIEQQSNKTLRKIMKNVQPSGVEVAPLPCPVADTKEESEGEDEDSRTSSFRKGLDRPIPGPSSKISKKKKKRMKGREWY